MTVFTSFFLSLGGIILVDLVLSGDNALVIGVAASHIKERGARLLALTFGGLLAIFLRIVFTIFATFIIGFSYLQAIGGLLILFIAVRLLIDTQQGEQSNKEQSPDETHILIQARHFSAWIGRKTRLHLTSQRKRFVLTMMTIAIADITMSLDNVIAVGAIAHQQILMLVLGLLVSVTLLLVSSGVVAELISRYPWLIAAASIVLSCVASDLIWRNIHDWPFIHNQPLYDILLYCILIVLVPLIAVLFDARQVRREGKPISTSEYMKRLLKVATGLGAN